MKGLSWAYLKTIINKLFVFGINSSFHNFITTIRFIIEEGMADIFHVYPYLVGTAGLQHTFHQCYIPKPFQHLIMSNGFFAMISLRVSFK